MKPALAFASQRQRLRARRLLNRRARRHALGVLEPFVYPVLTRKGPTMPKPSLQLTSQELAKLAPKLVTSTKLDTLCEEFLTVGARRSQINGQYDKLKAEMQKWYKKHGPKIETDEFQSTDIASHSSRIDPALLATLGVKASIIEKATVKTPYSYPKVVRKKDPVADEGLGSAELKRSVRQIRQAHGKE